MISVALATYNEEKNIRRCLNSVVSWVDEVIVVDGSSTDSTPKLARSLGAKLINTTNKPNFHINKQMAMDKSKGDLILQLDADEEVDQELKDFILKTHDYILSKSKLPQDYPAAWSIKRQNLFLGTYLKKGGQYPDPVIRLYRKGKARLPLKDVHEQMEVDGKVAWAEGHLIHYANPSFNDYIRKFDTYTSFKATQLKESGLKPSFGTGTSYLLLKPIATWFSLYVRHKGFMDGLPGFVFASFSGLHHAVAYIKLWEIYER